MRGELSLLRLSRAWAGSNEVQITEITEIFDSGSFGVMLTVLRPVLMLQLYKIYCKQGFTRKSLCLYFNKNQENPCQWHKSYQTFCSTSSSISFVSELPSLYSLNFYTFLRQVYALVRKNPASLKNNLYNLKWWFFFNLVEMCEIKRKPRKPFCLGWDFVFDVMSASFSLCASTQIKARSHTINLFWDFNPTRRKTPPFGL